MLVNKIGEEKSEFKYSTFNPAMSSHDSMLIG